MEKERYTIEQFELDEPNCIFDNKTQNVIFTLSGYHYDELSSLMNLLNQQDTRIKELEEENQKANIKNYLTDYYLVEKENQQLKERLSIKMEELHIAYCGIEDIKTRNGNLKAEIKQLKQSQKQLAISELKKLKDYFCEEYVDDEGYKTNDREITKDGCEIANEIDNQIKKLEKDFEKK